MYIYYHNTSDGSNRILFRAEVCRSDKTEDINNKDNDSYLFSEYTNSGNKVKGFVINNLEYIELSDKEKFSYQKLKDEYSVTMNQTKYILGYEEDFLAYKNSPKNITTGINGRNREKYIKNLKLIFDLEQSKQGNDLTKVKEYFNKSCVCCNDKKMKRTFTKKNGFTYYEMHHLLMKNLYRKENISNEILKDYKSKNELSKIIESDFNKITLCPVCHRELHYGLDDRRKEILDIIFEKREIEKKLIKLLPKHKYDKNKKNKLFDYIYEQYDVSREN